MYGLILAFGLWYLIMTVWFINASGKRGEYKEIVKEFGWGWFVIILLVIAALWWTILLQKDSRDEIFDFLGSK